MTDPQSYACIERRPMPDQPTKAEMLRDIERVKRHIPFPVWSAIKALIEAPGKCGSCPFGSMLKEYEEDDIESSPEPGEKRGGLTMREAAQLDNYGYEKEDIEKGQPAHSPAPPIERREGHCALKYDKTTRTIKTFDPAPPLPEVEEAMKRLADLVQHRGDCIDAKAVAVIRAALGIVEEPKT